MRAFVTGATGFIGAHLCKRLLAEGHSVLALVRDPKKADALPDRVSRLQGDLSIFADPDRVLPEVDVVFHLAAVVTASNADDYETINFGAVKDLVGCLARQSWKPRRLVFASSLAAAGPSPRGKRLTEQDPCAPIDAYGRAKRAAEGALAAAPFPTTSFRPAIVLGPRDPASLTFFKMASKGVGFRVAGPPQELSFIDVDDLVEAIVAMASDSGPEHHTYFVSHHEDLDSVKLWQSLSLAVGKRVRIVAVPPALLRGVSGVGARLSRLFGFTNQLDQKMVDQMTAPAFLCEAAALTKKHGWRARHDLDASVAKALAGYRQDGWL